VFYLSRNGGLSRNVPSITSVPRLFELPTIRLDWGFLAALGMAAVVSFVLFRTPLGFELRAAGHSRTAARYAGMGPGKAITLGMSLSGALIGMGGAFLSLGPAGGLTGFGGDGFVALALALLGGLRPSGIVLAALLYGALNNGAKVMVVETGVPLMLLVVVIALTIVFVAAPGLTRSIWRLRSPEPSLDAGSLRPAGPLEPL
jgi:simple sugar transport system permease protein